MLQVFQEMILNNEEQGEFCTLLKQLRQRYVLPGVVQDWMYNRSNNGYL